MIHIDGDALVYIAGFAADSRNGPFSHSAYNCKLIINSALNKTGEEEYKIFLTSKNPAVNFRTKVLDTYKKNRSKNCIQCRGTNLHSESFVEKIDKGNGEIFKRRCYFCKDCTGYAFDTKPVFYNRIRRFLIDYYGAVVVNFGEADDWLLTGKPDWVATHDKDIYQGGNISYYNLKSGDILHVEDQLGYITIVEKPMKDREGQVKKTKKGKTQVRKELKGCGFKWFCAQMIFGDRVDNIIKPYKGDGPVAIETIWGPLTSMRECWNMVKLYYHGTKQEKKLWDMAKLLWVARRPKEICNEKVIEKFIKKYDR